MDTILISLILGFSFAAVFGIMSLLHREGISLQFLLESVVLTLLITAASYLTGSQLNPVLFLAFLYVITMRSRLLTDLANLFSRRGRQRDAISLLQVALRLFPDNQSRFIVLVNMGIIQLVRENYKSAEEILRMVLEESKDGGLGIRYEAASHYNLGIALRKQGKDAQAVRHFREAVGVFPGSPYSKAAEKALEERRRGKKGGPDPAEEHK